MINYRKNNRGFVAITLVIIVSGILLAFSSLQSIEVSEFFDQVLLKEYRLMNYYNAQSCIDQAMLKISSDYFFTLSSPISIPYLNCRILKVYENSGYLIIETQGNYKNIYINRIAKVKLHDNRLELISVE